MNVDLLAGDIDSEFRFNSAIDGWPGQWVVPTGRSQPDVFTGGIAATVAIVRMVEDSRAHYSTSTWTNGIGFAINLQLSNQTNLTSNRAVDVGAAWSPDGGRIAFRVHPGDIYVMDADGSNIVNLTEEASFEADPTWSPTP